ncbi:unnamed protein product [Symbiodinium necroappetens]|uniref:Uncharacterized protein n=1 Tax=Symbiodinium necroappetens TaxID=1628268 RepID=A0A812QX55_9DINO|nr:unnamed protein product [Symbiodinium necroappetens]
MPQLARSAGYPKNLVILCIRCYTFLVVNYICQGLILYMIAKEELVWDAFAGQMFLCDFGRSAGDCVDDPTGPNCVGPGGTTYAPARIYSWSVWSTRIYVRDALKAVFPEKAAEIQELVDPGESLGVNEHAKSIRGWSEMDLCKLKVAGMPLAWKIINIFLVVLPKLLLWSLTAQAGITFLMETSTIDDLVVNSVALAFILQIDELLCSELMPETNRAIVDMLEDYELQGYEEANTVEQMKDSELLEEYEEKLKRDWSWMELANFIPFKLLLVTAFTVLFVELYYWRNCVRGPDGGMVSKNMHYPQSTRFSCSAQYSLVACAGFTITEHSSTRPCW